MSGGRTRATNCELSASRVDVMFAMHRGGTYYHQKRPRGLLDTKPRSAPGIRHIPRLPPKETWHPCAYPPRKSGLPVNLDRPFNAIDPTRRVAFSSPTAVSADGGASSSNSIARSKPPETSPVKR